MLLYVLYSSNKIKETYHLAISYYLVSFWLLFGLLFDSFLPPQKNPTYFPVFWEDNHPLINHFEGYDMLEKLSSFLPMFPSISWMLNWSKQIVVFFLVKKIYRKCKWGLIIKLSFFFSKSTNFFLDIPEVFKNGIVEEFSWFDQGLSLTLEISQEVLKLLWHILSK